jgi:hypothetical protein
MIRPVMSDNKCDSRDDGWNERRVRGREGKVLEVSLRTTCPYITCSRSTESSAEAFFIRLAVQSPLKVTRNFAFQATFPLTQTTVMSLYQLDYLN